MNFISLQVPGVMPPAAAGLSPPFEKDWSKQRRGEGMNAPQGRQTSELTAKGSCMETGGACWGIRGLCLSWRPTAGTIWRGSPALCPCAVGTPGFGKRKMNLAAKCKSHPHSPPYLAAHQNCQWS